MKIVDINGSARECFNIAPDKNFPGFMKAEFKSKWRRGYTHAEWYSIADFIKNNPQLVNLAKKAAKTAKEDLGVVNKATRDSLTDKNKKWPKDIFAGYPLWISRGKGEGQTRTILANDIHHLTIDKPWEIIPDKTSQYVISFNVHNPHALGNTLPGTVVARKTKKKKPVLSGVEG